MALYRAELSLHYMQWDQFKHKIDRRVQVGVVLVVFYISSGHYSSSLMENLVAQLMLECN